MATCPAVDLAGGYKMPVVGLGTFDNLKDDQVSDAVKAAIDAGYRLLDCAWIYRSEGAVGRGIADRIQAGVVSRQDVFVTTKLWCTFLEPERVEDGLKDSLRELGLDYIDLFLMHWPIALKEQDVNKKAWIMDTEMQPADVDFLDTWKAMERLVDKRLARSIGVSNFNAAQLTRLLNTPGLRIKPTNVQLESHPLLHNQEMLDLCRSRGITVTAFSPLAKGGSTYAGKPVENILVNPIITDIAEKHKRTPAQVVLKWALQRGLCIVPKSCTPARIRENFQLFDFELTDEDMTDISSLNKNRRLVTFEKAKDFPEYPF